MEWIYLACIKRIKESWNCRKTWYINSKQKKEFEESLALNDIELIQFPYNILENRFTKFIDKINLVKERRSLKIHARSVFLQGLLLSKNKTIG